jgi:hypothetical protein
VLLATTAISASLFFNSGRKLQIIQALQVQLVF